MRSIAVSVATATDEGDYLQVAFAEEIGGPDEYVLLQVAKEFDDQDRRLGMDGIYLEINDQAHSSYRAINSIEIKGRSVRIYFVPEALGLMPELSPLAINCRVDQSHFLNVNNMIVRIGILSSTPVETGIA